MLTLCKQLALCFLLSISCQYFASAQIKQQANPIYIDADGVLRWSKNKQESTFFGTNYTVPFAYGYRSHKALQVDLEQAIDNDVYHFSRLGLNAFRVHVWDTEITDSAGNLLQNDHLRLFDYLVFRLQQKGIYVLITPIAYWGNGYPERDEKTQGFSSIWPKQKALVNDTAIAAQENYLRQFLQHKNPYTKKTYQQDTSIIALEINNEPHHSGPKQAVTTYINRMISAVKNVGWTKPVFYNISESPAYADAVVKSKAEGYSFQWYPTGLVAGHTLQGNYLPNVSLYKIPFGDTIKEFKKHPLMVYEFDAGDVLQSNMYPAMARSFRSAGFQWATQFAYDPMATAYANTEYQTHFVNLAYSPAKAISLMIAAKAFHAVPRNKQYGMYPKDTLFEGCRVSYINGLSEWNTGTAFYYSNHTTTIPARPAAIQYIAGVGNSQLVQYSGTGAYFIDKVKDGIWRLEVMPDAHIISDPFAKASPRKAVVGIEWRTQQMHIALDDLGKTFFIKGHNTNNTFMGKAADGKIFVQPGVYILSKDEGINATIAVSISNNFVAPKSSFINPTIVHKPAAIINENTPLAIQALVPGALTSDKVTLEYRHTSNRWRTVPFNTAGNSVYTALVPAALITPGIINYRIIVQDSTNNYHVFPGAHKGNPYAWDAYENESWQTFIASDKNDLSLFSASADRSNLNLYMGDWRSNTVEYAAGATINQLVQKINMAKPTSNTVAAWQLYIGDKIAERSTQLNAFTSLKIRAAIAGVANGILVVKLIDKNARAYAYDFTVNNNLKVMSMDLKLHKADSIILLPRPYPGFLPLHFSSIANKAFNLANLDKMEVYYKPANPESTLPINLFIESIDLAAGD